MLELHKKTFADEKRLPITVEKKKIVERKNNFLAGFFFNPELPLKVLFKSVEETISKFPAMYLVS